MLQREYVKIKPNPKRRWFATTIFKCSGSIAQCNVLVSFHSRRTSDRDKKNKRPKVLWIIWCPDKLNCIYVRWSVVILSKPSFILYPTIQQKPNTEQMLCCLDLKQRVQHFQILESNWLDRSIILKKKLINKMNQFKQNANRILSTLF